MKQQYQNLDVKNLCSRKLWELAASSSVDSQELRAIAGELQLRRHYLNELERLIPVAATQH
ncbi:MAG: hypothetical protein JWM78_1583 [Verrucomicrobiaceae bacterium]|nr:hypothetical protein [Verrucomicrobiaceae bacterium]